MITVFGDLMLDEYVEGKVERISPEAPVPVFFETNRYHELGGAANVAKIISSNGFDCRLAGAVGDDYAGEKVRELLKNYNIGSKLLTIKEFKTTLKTRFLAGSNQVFRLDNEQMFSCSADTMDTKFNKTLACASILIISDYDKGFVHSLRGRITKLARSAKIIVDPKTKDLGDYRGSYLVKPNLSEFKQFCEYAGFKINDQDYKTFIEPAVLLLKRHDVDHLLITLNKDGALLVSADEKSHKFNQSKVEVSDVTGAGDTVLAFLAMELDAGKDLHSAIRTALRASVQSVQKIGTQTVLYKDLMQDYDCLSDYAAGKYVTMEYFKTEEFNRIRLDKTVVFTNGCFDIFHSGHASYLRKARKLGDILIVGINSDFSISRLKGEKRPINPEKERISLLLDLGLIDFCIKFDDDTPIDLIKQILPDILVKGSDYSEEEVVGSEVVRDNGGRVELIEFRAGMSSSSIIDSIKSKFR